MSEEVNVEDLKEFKRLTLVEEVQSILQKYPDDGQIFKEIIQNAEDAGATKLIFIYDKNDYRFQDGEYSYPGLSKYQGPALYAYNNARFTGNDWKGITSLGTSNKLRDPLKVGRFGLGFKSVFHLTDLPTIASGKYFAYLDPLKETFETEVKMLDLQESRFHKHCDFRAFSTLPEKLTMVADGKCNGTLFRFALRSSESEISKVCYDDKRFSGLIKTFMNDGYLNLLFLKRIQSIMFYEIEKDCADMVNIYTLKLSEKCRNFAQKRQEFLTNISANVKRKEFPTIVLNHDVEIEETCSSELKHYSYAVSEYFGYQVEDRAEDEFLEMIVDVDLSYIPLVAAAMPLDSKDGGHVFCGLPLPLRERCMSGLPAHVNGFFALGPDRKDLKWKALGAVESNDKSVNWNLHLIDKLLPNVFYNLIMYLIERGTDLCTIIKSWPIAEEVNEKWTSFLSELFQQLSTSPCVCIEYKKKWVKPCDALFIDQRNFKSEKQYKTLCRLLEEAALNFTQMPEHIKRSLRSENEVSKNDVQSVLMTNLSLYQAMSAEEQCLILSYAIQDVEDISCLQGIKLLLLKSGRYASIGDLQETIYIPTEIHHCNLFPSMESILDPNFFSLGGESGEEILELLKTQSGKFNFILLDNWQKVIEALKLNLNERMGDHKLYDWPNDLSYPGKDWLHCIWNYQREQAIPIEQLDGVNLIPVWKGKKRYLCKVTKKSLVVCHEDQLNNDMEKTLQTFLQEIGIVFFNESSLDTHTLQNLNLMERVFCATDIGGILQAIQHAADEENGLMVIQNALDKTPRILSNQILALIESLPTMPEHLNVFYNLNLFKCFHGDTFVSIKECKIVDADHIPNGVEWRSEFDHLVTMQSLSTRIRDHHFKEVLVNWSFEDIFGYILDKINMLSSRERNNLSDFVLDVMAKKKLSSEFVGKMKKQNLLVCTKDGDYLPPNLLFIENKEFSAAFFNEKNKFAHEKYNPEILTLFGLKTTIAQVMLGDMENSIQSILENTEKLLEKNRQAVLEKVQAIISMSLKRDFNLSKFDQFCWVPVHMDKPAGYPTTLPWYCNENCITMQCPSNVFSLKHSKLVGSSACIVHSFLDPLYSQLQKDFYPSIDIVVNHLSRMIEMYNDDERGSYKDMIDCVYDYLAQCDNVLVAERFKDPKIKVWQGSLFVDYDKILLNNMELDVRPYYHRLPNGSKLTGILKNLGCASKTELDIYIDVLHCIKENKEVDSNDRFKDFNLTVEIVKYLAEHVSDLSDESKDRILVPCDSVDLELVPLKKCYYHDFDGTNSLNEMSSCNILHHHFNKDVAEKLGIADILSHVLSGEDGLEFESCGQHEPLTLRLKKLLKDYEDGLAIPKELIQNADDAGATEVYFLYDQRENMDLRGSLINDGMKDWQGPALWVYNNAQFTEEDFSNITKLNAGTKEYDTTKIGKFGLGFSAVYHLTDVPSFLSGNNMIIFDPHTNYLGKAIKDKTRPGIRIPLKKTNNSKAFVLFNDQFKVFHGVFGVHLDFAQGDVEPFPGTLFRLPLRKASTAASSEIKNMEYNNNEVVTLFEKFKESLDHLLLFTENVKVVKVLQLRPNATDPSTETELLFSIEKSPKILKEKNLLLSDSSVLKNVNHILKDMSLLKADALPSAFIQVQTNTIRGRERMEKNWFLYLTAGCPESFYFADKYKGFIPCGGVAMEYLNGTEIALQSQISDKFLFCFLPLPEPSLLPAHINGAFEVSSDRKQLHKKNMDGKRSNDPVEWNTLLCRGVGQAYFNLVLELKDKCQHLSLSDWLKLLPGLSMTNGTNPCMFDLAKTLFSLMFQSNEALFPSTEKGVWCTWKDVRVLCGSFETNLVDRAITYVNWYYKKKATHRYFCLPFTFEFLDLLKVLGFEKELSIISEDEFIEMFFEQVEDNELDSNLRNEIVLSFLKRKPDEGLLKSMLTGTKCIPTTPNGLLCSPDMLIKPESKAAKLYDPSIDEVFPLSKFDVPYLETLGMESKSILWSKILNRSKSVCVLNSNGKYIDARSRSKWLIPFIEEKLLEQADEIVHWINELMGVPFIPTKRKSENSLFPNWKSDRQYFAAPCDLLRLKFENIACVTSLICDEDFDQLLQRLGANETPLFDTVMDQIRELIEIYDSSRTTKEEYVKILQSLYTYLDIDGNVTEEQFKQLQSMKVLYTNKCELVTPETMYFQINNSVNEIPGYMYELPVVLRYEFPKVMRKLKVKDFCDVEGYLNVLAKVKEIQFNMPLEDDLLNAVVRIFNFITDSRNVVSEDAEVFLPDKNRKMQECKKMCYKDTHWMPENPSTLYTHNDLLPERCARLKIKASRKEHLSRKTRGIPFGQNEKLTTRLKNLLKGYSSEDDVLKELLQNADDAGATEVDFLLDKRRHDSEKVFSDKWKEMQGPALLVANNGEFTEDNLHAIHDLGEDNKSKEPLKTGKYGVGFNAVYAITDCPSFLTPVKNAEDVLVIFDPNLKYVEIASKEEPGIMFENARKELENIYTDVKSAYLFTEFDSTQKTLFRFPLRDKKMVKKSNISRKITTVATVQKRLREWIKKAPNILLFLHNVKKLNFWTFERGKKTECEVIEAFDYGVEEVDKMNYKTFQLELADNLSNINFVTDNYKRLSRRLCIQHRSYNYQHVVHIDLIQQCGFSSMQQLSVKMGEMIESKELCLLPKGAVATISTDETCHHCRNVQKKRKDSNTTMAGQVYCCLPLPITSILPIAVNGHFVLDYETRRNLWSNKTTLEYIWNKAILKYCILPCYIEYLEMWITSCLSQPTKATELSTLKASFYKLFPHAQEFLEDYWNFFSSEFYKRVFWEDLSFMVVMNSAKTCLTFSKPKSDFLVYKFSEETTHSLLQTLQNAFIEVDTVDEEIERSFYISGVPLTVINHDIARIRLGEQREKIIPNEESIHVSKSVFKSLKHVIELLRYCLHFETSTLLSQQAKNFPYKNSLQDLPLCLLANGCIEVFSSANPKMFTQFSDIFKPNKNLFIHKLFWHLLKTMEFSAGHFNCLQDFDLSKFNELLMGYLPTHIYLDSKELIPLNTKESKEIVTEKWLRCVWKFLSCHECPALVDYIGKWSLLLIKRNDELFLSRINQCRSVLYLDGPHRSSVNNLISVLRSNAMVYEPAKSNAKFDTLYKSDFAAKLFGSIDDLDNFVDALHFSYSIDPSDFIVTSDEAHVMLQHTNSIYSSLVPGYGLTTERYVSCNTVLKLKELPLFERVDGSLGNAVGTVVVLPGDTPKIDFSVLEKEFGCVFLKENIYVSKLFKAIGLDTINLLSFFLSYTFSKIHVLTDKDIYECILYVKNHILVSYSCYDDQDKARLRKSLMSLKFISCGDGLKKCASEVYDPTIDIFKLMLEPTELLPDIYKESSWLKFFREIGMIQKLNENDFKRFARALVKEDNIDKFSKASKILCENLQSNYNFGIGLYSATLLLSIQTLPFLLPRKINPELESICPSKNSKLKKICFENSSMPSQINLVWSVKAILPDYAFNLQQSLLSHLGVATDDKLDLLLVLENIKNVVKSAANQIIPDEKRKFYVEVFTAFYDYLDKQNITSNTQYFQSIPCILTDKDKRLDIPNNAVLSEDCILPPYLNAVSEKHGKHFDLFRRLGCMNKPQPKHYVRVIGAIHSKAKQNPLHINELITVKKAVCYLSKCSGPIELHDMDLYLPTGTFQGTENRLTLSQNVIFSNDPNREERLKRFTEQILLTSYDDKTDINEDLLKRLPLHMKPKLMSDVLEEVLVCNSQSCSVDDDHISMKIKSRLRSLSFLRGFERLMEHERKSKCSTIPETSDDLAIHENILKSIKMVEVSVFSNVTTMYYYNNSAIPESEEKKDMYLKYVDGKLKIVFSEDAEENPSLYLEVAAELLKIFNNPLKETKMLLPTLLQVPLEDTPNLLDRHSINRHTSKIEWGEIPSPGDLVPLELYSLLINEFSDFVEGEYIAVERVEQRDETVFEYGIIRRIDENITKILRVYGVQMTEDEDKLTDIGIIHLYRFQRDCTVSNIASHAETTFKSAIEKIRKILREAKKFSPQELEKVIRRLYLEWHPEKHPDGLDITLVEKVFKALKIEIEMINSEASKYFSSWNKRARREYRCYQEYRVHFERSGRKRSFSETLPTFNAGNPQPVEAKRWLRQAEFDLTATMNESSPEWKCFKAHQAAEKALKAAKYQDGYERTQSHTLYYISNGLPYDLKTLASSLESNIGSSASMRYPDRWERPYIPHDKYDEVKADRVSEMAEKIISNVKERMAKMDSDSED